MQCHEGIENLLFKEVIVVLLNNPRKTQAVTGLLIRVSKDYLLVATDTAVMQIDCDTILFVTKNSPMDKTTFEEWLRKNKIDIIHHTRGGE